MHNCYMAMTLHSTLDVALVARRTIKAIVGGVLACEIPCGGTRYVGSGLSKYEGMRCINRWERISGKPMITSMQLSITLASILFKILSDFVTSLKKFKSNTIVPYIELLNCEPGTSCLLDLTWCAPATVPPCCCCSYFPVDKRCVSTSVKAVKYTMELRMDTRHCR